MKKFSDLPLIAQLGIFALLPVIIIGVAEYLYFPLSIDAASTLQDMQTANADGRKKIADLRDENTKNKKIEQNLKTIQNDTKAMGTRLEELRSIVPAESDLDSFIQLISAAGKESGVHVRRYSPLPHKKAEFYMEMPLEIEFDGTFHNMLQFFSKLGSLPRITNVSNLAVGPINGTVKNVKKRYQYSPSETIVASCIVTTYYRPPDQANAAAKKK